MKEKKKPIKKPVGKKGTVKKRNIGHKILYAINPFKVP